MGLKIASKIYARFWAGKKATTMKKREVVDQDQTSLLPTRTQPRPLFSFDDKEDATSNVLEDFFDSGPGIIPLRKTWVCSPLILPFSAPHILNLFFLQTALFCLRQPRPLLHNDGLLSSNRKSRLAPLPPAGIGVVPENTQCRRTSPSSKSDITLTGAR